MVVQVFDESWIRLKIVCQYDILFIIIDKMSKTELSQVSTHTHIKATSFFTSSHRTMYRKLKTNEPFSKNHPLAHITSTHLPNDLLLFNPLLINSLSWPQVFSLENNLKVSVKGNFYQISGLKNSKKFLPRKSQTNSELIYFISYKQVRKIHLITIERFIRQGNNREQVWLHINISKFDLETEASQTYDFYLLSEGQTEEKNHQIWDFCSFQTVENSKKGLFVFRVCNLNKESKRRYKIVLGDLIERGLRKHQIDEKKLKVFCQIELSSEINLRCQNERFLKTIKSQLEDSVLIITNREIYQVQIEQIGETYQLNLKEYKLSKIIAATKKNQGQYSPENGKKRLNYKQEQVVDCQFMNNGRKIMILTNYQQVLILRARKLQFSQSIVEAFVVARLEEKYHLQSILCTKLYSMNGCIALQFHTKNDVNLIKNSSEALMTQSDKQQNSELVTKGILLLKVQNNSLSFLKLINLQLQQKDISHMAIHECVGSDEILVQYIDKKNPCLISVIKCRILMTELNVIIKLQDLEYNNTKIVNLKMQNDQFLQLNHFQPLEPEKKYIFVEMPLTSRVFFMLNEKELVCYKILNQIDSQKINKSIRKLFTHSFFEKPLKITVSPLGIHFAILFKEFVKFYYVSYSSVKNYYTLNIKSINDVQYVGQGQKMLISCQDGKIFLVNSYDFREQKILEFYGQPIQSKMIDQKHLTVRSSKNILYFFESGWDHSQNRNNFEKKYEIRLEENDQYYVTQEHLIVFRKNAVCEVYAHNFKPISVDLPEAQRQPIKRLREIHEHLIRRFVCKSFQTDEIASRILLSEELGFLFVATNRGNLKQYFWPLQYPNNPHAPQVFTQQISSHKIISLQIDANFTYLYIASQTGSIAQLQVNQYINGERMSQAYLFSKKTVSQEQQKRQFTNRSYFIDNFTPAELCFTRTCQQNIQELEFFVGKLQDDIEQMTKHLQIRLKETQTQLQVAAKQDQKQFQLNLHDQQAKFKLKMFETSHLIEQNNKKFIIERGKEAQNYQQKLLKLYKQSDRLKSILVTQDKKLSQERDSFKKQYEMAIKQLDFQGRDELAELKRQYKVVQQRKRLLEKQIEFEDREQIVQKKLFKVKVDELEQQQLTKAEEVKQGLLTDNIKLQKKIQNLKNKVKSLQNLISEINVQIPELIRDREEYERRKENLYEELREKQEIIEKIEKEIVEYLKNTNNMKTTKKGHEFELRQYQQEVTPLLENFISIDQNVNNTNNQIVKHFNSKIEKNHLIKQQQTLVNILKEKKKQILLIKLKSECRLKNMTDKIVHLAQNPYDSDIQAKLRALINQSSKVDEVIKINEARQKEKREAGRLIRQANITRKEIEEEDKRQENHTIKKQHDLNRHQVENTTLIGEINQLRKYQKYLRDKQNRLEEKINMIKEDRRKTLQIRVPSLNFKKDIDKRLTPFQRYEQEQQTHTIRKNQDTSATRLSNQSQSRSFIKEYSSSGCKYEKLEDMRERIRRIANPQLQIIRNKEIKKIQSSRARFTSRC